MGKWEMVRLGDVCRPRQWKTIATTDLSNMGYPVYGANGKIGFYNEYTHEKATVLVTCRGATCGTINICEPYSYVNGNAMALDDLSDIVDIRYLSNYLTKRGFSDVISGSAQPQIIRSNIEKVEIPLPSLPVQQQIADVLNRASALIEKRKAQIEKLDLLIKSQFIEMFGDPVTNPRSWSMTSIADVCNIIVDCPHSTPEYLSEDTGYSCLRTSILKNYRVDWSKVEYISSQQYAERTTRYVPRENDIVYSREGAILGIAAIINQQRNVALGQRMMLFSVDLNKCHYIYLWLILNQRGVTQQVQDKIGGSASPHVNVKDIKAFKIPLPLLSLQNQFAAFVNQVEAQKSLLQQSLTKLEQNYKSLMQKCFAGEIF